MKLENIIREEYGLPPIYEEPGEASG